MKSFHKFFAIGLLSSFLIAFIWLLFYYWKKAKKNQPIVPQIAKGGYNNPGYLINTSTKWMGEVNSDVNKVFEDFISQEMGVRAWLINLRNLIKKNGGSIKVDKMIDILTPGGPGTGNSEQARNNYKAFIKKMIGTDIITTDNISKVAYAVFQFEANPSYINKPLSEADILTIQSKYNIV